METVEKAYQPLNYGVLYKERWRWLMAGSVASIGMASFLPWDMHLLFGFAFAIWLSILALLDCRYGLLYDKLVAPLAAMGLLLAVSGCNAPLTEALPGALLSGAFLWTLRMISKGGLGFGDVKFGSAMMLWLNWHAAVVALFMSFILGGVWACALLLCGKGEKGAALPFGPCLAIGAYLAFICGEECWQAYVGVF